MRSMPEMEQKIRVLVADDNPEVLFATADLVMDFPGVLVVSLATTVEEAVRSASWHKPDLVLVDAWLKGGGAGAVAQRIRLVSESTLVVALASAREPGLSRLLLDFGVLGCFDKESLAAVLPGILAAIRDRQPIPD